MRKQNDHIVFEMFFYDLVLIQDLNALQNIFLKIFTFTILGVKTVMAENLCIKFQKFSKYDSKHFIHSFVKRKIPNQVSTTDVISLWFGVIKMNFNRRNQNSLLFLCDDLFLKND